jgi:hypothetical protein
LYTAATMLNGLNGSCIIKIVHLTFLDQEEKGGGSHPARKFVRPTFFSQVGGVDFKNACYTGVQGGVILCKVHDYFLIKFTLAIK